jgi:predicted metal-dependent hydrolase
VRVSTPKRIRKSIIRNFLIDKIEWIKKHLNKIEKQLPEKPPKYVTGEIHTLFGKQYKLHLTEVNKKPEVHLKGDQQIYLNVRPGSNPEIREKVMREWYRERLKERIPVLIQKYEKKLGVKVKEWRVKKMKTRWGTCNIRDSRVWFSLELAKKPEICLEYVVLHELAHLIERYHNKRFKALLSREMPEWRRVEAMMNGQPR